MVAAKPPSTLELHAMLSLAKSLAREAADVAAPFVSRITVTRKADNSIVTDADHAVQEHILSAIAAAYPEHGICAEETVRHPQAHASSAAARFTWVIDPIDGTRNFAVGLPCYSTAIAVLDRGVPVVGVVYEHNFAQMFTVHAGQGVLLNERPVDLRTPVPHGDTLVAVPSSKDKLTVDVLTRWLATPGIVYRSLGSTAHHLALVACGALDATFCKRCKLWDIAAGTLMVQEAGGRATDPWGQELIPFDLSCDPHRELPTLAGRPDVHARLLDSIQDLRQAQSVSRKSIMESEP